MPSPPLIPKAMNDGWLPWLTSQLDLKSVLSCLIIEHLRGVTLSVKITFSSLLFDVFGLPPALYFFIFGEACFFFFFETSMACICFSSPLPLPVHLQSWPEISIFHDCVLLKSLSGLKTSLKPLSPLTEQVRHPKYLGALGFCSVFDFATEMNLCNYPLNSNQARVQSSQTCFVQSA